MLLSYKLYIKVAVAESKYFEKVIEVIDWDKLTLTRRWRTIEII